MARGQEFSPNHFTQESFFDLCGPVAGPDPEISRVSSLRALTIRQPWAELIISGKRPVEVRTWSTNYRGPLLVHAGLAFDKRLRAQHGVAVPDLGAVIGLVYVERVEKVDTSARWTELRPIHLEDGPLTRSPLYVWYLGRIMRFAEPTSWQGRLGFHCVPLVSLGRTNLASIDWENYGVRPCHSG